jgi:hypothetical protein
MMDSIDVQRQGKLWNQGIQEWLFWDEQRPKWWGQAGSKCKGSGMGIDVVFLKPSEEAGTEEVQGDKSRKWSGKGD